jgi:hypothetical protein
MAPDQLMKPMARDQKTAIVFVTPLVLADPLSRYRISVIQKSRSLQGLEPPVLVFGRGVFIEKLETTRF